MPESDLLLPGIGVKEIRSLWKQLQDRGVVPIQEPFLLRHSHYQGCDGLRGGVQLMRHVPGGCRVEIPFVYQDPIACDQEGIHLFDPARIEIVMKEIQEPGVEPF